VRIRSQVTGVDAAALGQRGGILVDEDLRTSVPDVFAVGDAAVKRDAFAGQGEPEPFALIPLALKLLVDPETDRILGAQGVGHDGVDKRIDVLATAIAGGLTASASRTSSSPTHPPTGPCGPPSSMRVAPS
jgi:pyruvate/2-oxoglutarate dehydrogenase complex dihydrolipoamide dehydrogenase (E3) component